jgi:hypothetical protein
MPHVTEPPTGELSAEAEPIGRGPRTAWFGLLVVAVLIVGGGLLAILAGALGAPGPATALDPPRFVDDSASAGVDHRYDGDFEYFVGGGVAVLDCDADGRPDLYFAGGSEPAALYRNQSLVGGSLRFEVVPDKTTDLGAVTGAYPLDIDGDGQTDLAVLRIGENVLLRGLGDCRFERANEAWGFDGGDGWTTAFSATWEDESALPTLAVGDYLERPAAEDGSEHCADNVLIRPTATGDRYAAPVPLTPGWCGLSMLFSDWDRSGQRDLRISNDRHYYGEASDGQEQLWHIAIGEPPRPYTDADGWKPLRIWGMGIASQDLDGDGRPEVFLTSQNDNKLQTLESGAGGPSYQDIALRAGATAHRPYAGDVALGSTGWHPEFQDVNNDGFMDLFISKGNVEAMPEFAARDPSNLLLGQADGTFIEVADEAGIVDYERGRGAALVDLNMDGMLDLVEVNRRTNVKLWRDVGWGEASMPRPMGGWIALRLEQPGADRDAIGAWVQVRVGDRVVEREVTVGGGHAGGQLAWIHFGLGEANPADVRVLWPDGEPGPWQTVEANRFAEIIRGASDARILAP